MRDTGEKRKEAEALGELRRLALLVEYEGTRYHGFQYQSNATSIQGELEEAIYRLTGERSRVQGAGRTDAGVHALGQVAAFDTWAGYPLVVFLQALNHYLPEDISVRKALEVPLDFDPRRGAVSREYRYSILNSATPSSLLRRSVHLMRSTLDVTAMQEAARLLEGQRDFAPFSGPLPAERSSTVRNMYRCSVDRDGDLIALEMIASGFLPQQVRRTAGALIEVGLGRLNLQQFSDLASRGTRGAASWALPPKGLCLVKVNYPDIHLSDERGDMKEPTTLIAMAGIQ